MTLDEKINLRSSNISTRVFKARSFFSLKVCLKLRLTDVSALTETRLLNYYKR